MKTKFGYYYNLSPEREQEFIQNCMYVLDTNVLLDILRLGKDLAEKAINTLKSNKKRIIIPYYVGKEYHKHFIEEVKNQFDAHNDAVNKITIDDVCNCVFQQIKKVRFSESEREEIKSEFKNSVDNLLNRLREGRDYYKDLLKTNKLQADIAEILNGTVLDSLSLEYLKEIEHEGEERYTNKIPPGYKDNGKRDNKFGDLIIWKEILNYALNNPTDICFVSRDLKEDWYEKINGERICPRYELQEEF